MTQQPPSIMLVGPWGSGKTAIAEAYAVQTSGVRLSLAGSLRSEVAVALAFSDTNSQKPFDDRKYAAKVFEHLGRMTTIETKDQYRAILQWWGTEYRRAQDPMYWINRLLELTTAYSDTTPFAVDDVRFDNEYETLKSRGFELVRLQPGPYTREDPANAGHASEAQWMNWPATLMVPFNEGVDLQAARILEALTVIRELK